MDEMQWSEPQHEDEQGPPTIKNHSVTHFNGFLYCFGGYDGRRNHQTLLLYNVREQQWVSVVQAEDERMATLLRRSRPGVVVVTGTPPAGRNGHTATLSTDDEQHARILILGGWLGQGPLAASDMHVLSVSPDELRWFQPTIHGVPPGPCNMHSADFCAARREVFVFRGGNGREYLNDLHALHVDTYTWRRVEAHGSPPQQRANHSSALLEETQELFIFGGWNGRERLNDIHILDIETSTWSCPHVGGILPHPRAGMTLTAMNGRLFLFGGSGTSSKCFQDLQILDRNKMAWLDVMQNNETHASNGSANSAAGSSSRKQASMSGGSRKYYDVDNMDAESEYMSSGGSVRSPRTDWRSRDATSLSGTVSSGHSRLAAANPNDEDTPPSILIQGVGPGRRAGHTATAVHRQLFVFGGSCGSDYLNDFFVLDTDPPPRARVHEPASIELLSLRLRHFFNEEEFSDVTFVVENQRVYGHKLVLSLVSDCFRAMFTTASGFRESASNAEIEIPNCSHDAFLAMMEYIYSGRIPKPNFPGSLITANGTSVTTNMHHVERIVELLELADQFILDHLKQKCEALLAPVVGHDTVEYLHQIAIKTNANQLMNMCEHFERNQSVTMGGNASPPMTQGNENQQGEASMLLQQQQQQQQDG